MKAVRITNERPGLTESKAQEIWDAFEKFGGYGFNKSHAAAYATISYQSMFLKTHYPAAFYAAALSILGDDKHRAIVKDALNRGIAILPPDINISTDRIEIAKLPDGRQALFAPFSAVLGCSTNGCQAIMRAREKVGGRFESLEQFEASVEKRACNARVRTALNKVGAFASIVPGSDHPLHESRRRDQAELMGSLIIDAVKVKREFEMNPRKQAEISHLMEELRTELSLGEELVTPQCGVSPKLMIILDNANGNDAKSKIFMNAGYDDIKNRLDSIAGLKMGEVYATGVCKKVKNKDVPYTRDEEETFIEFAKKELEIVRPTYVLACGRMASGLFNDKDKPSDLVGRKEYIASLDVTVFHAFNPGILYFRPEEADSLDAILADIGEVLSA